MKLFRIVTKYHVDNDSLRIPRANRQLFGIRNSITSPNSVPFLSSIDPFPRVTKFHQLLIVDAIPTEEEQSMRDNKPSGIV
jgi:hypothetical protein